MKRIVIYAYNEQIEELKPMARDLEKQGAQVRFMNIKYDELAKCDIALTDEVYLERVKAIFEGTKTDVRAFDADVSKDIEEANRGTVPRQGEGAGIDTVDKVTAEAVADTAADAVAADAADSVSMTVGENADAPVTVTRAPRKKA